MKMLKYLASIKVLCSLMLLFGLFSCGNDDEPGGDNPNESTEFTPSPELVSYLVDGIDFGSGESGVEVSFTSNKSWSVSSDASWCTFSPSSGRSGANTFSIKVERNQISERREVIITLQVAEVANYIKIRQNGNSNFEITMKNPGTLSSYLGDGYLDITTLRIAGPLNGNDFNLITQMGLQGNLSILDLSEATIVEGGAYNSLRPQNIKTRDNEITEDMFFCYNNLTELYLPNKATKICKTAIFNCPKLRILKLPEELRVIEDMGLYYLNAIEDLELPEGLEELGMWSLSGLESIKSLTLPSTVKHLGSYVFSGDKRLNSIHCKSVEPPICERTYASTGMLLEPITNGAKLYVPKGSLSAYKNDEQWGLFETIIEE